MKKILPIVLLLLLTGAIALLAGCVSAPGPGASSSGAPPEVVQYAKDWPLPNRDYNNTRATVDSPINSGNVNSLGIAWSFLIPGTGSFGGANSNPIIMGDTAYFQDAAANVFALDMKTGSPRWEYVNRSKSVEGPNGPAVGWNKVFFAKDAYTLAAVDAATGTEIWNRSLSSVNTTGIDIAPTVYNGMVYTSTVPGTGDIFYSGGGIGIIYALDQQTGAVRWNFSTVDSPDIWGNPKVNSGGGCWYTPSIDLRTGIMFWGTGNPAPFPGTPQYPNGGSRPGPNLYTSCILALDSGNGQLKWYTQAIAHDLFDYDFQIPPILASANIGGRQQDIVIGAGKMGRVFAFNRTTGAILWITDVGTHNGNDRLSALPPGNTTILPGTLGGVETPMSFANGVVYVPWNDRYSVVTPESTFPNLVQQPFGDATGGITAIDVNTGKVLWENKLDHLNVGSTLVVNDLVFTGTYDGTIFAFKDDTGEQLWKFLAPAGINAWPAVANDTILWPCGSGGTPSVIALRLGTGQDMKACTQDSDCVPAQCCHPTGCINRTYKGVCTLLCTASCEGPIDCGAGHCGCVNGTCGVLPGPGSS